MNCFSGILILACSTFVVEGSVNGYVSPADIKKFLLVLSKSLSEDNSDLTGIYHGTVGFKLLNNKINGELTRKNCDIIKKTFKGTEDPEIIYQVYTAWSNLGCPGKIHKEETLKVILNLFVSSKCENLFFSTCEAPL